MKHRPITLAFRERILDEFRDNWQYAGYNWSLMRSEISRMREPEHPRCFVCGGYAEQCKANPQGCIPLTERF